MNPESVSKGPRLIHVVCVALAVAVAPQDGAGQQTLASRTCTGTANGLELNGVFVLEHWTSAGSYRYYGRFQDEAQNVYELEVFTGRLDGGVGGTWINGMRHRETHINLAVQAEGFAVHAGDGAVATFNCPSTTDELPSNARLLPLETQAGVPRELNVAPTFPALPVRNADCALPIAEGVVELLINE